MYATHSLTHSPIPYTFNVLIFRLIYNKLSVIK